MHGYKKTANLDRLRKCYLSWLGKPTDHFPDLVKHETLSLHREGHELHILVKERLASCEWHDVPLCAGLVKLSSIATLFLGTRSDMPQSPMSDLNTHISPYFPEVKLWKLCVPTYIDKVFCTDPRTLATKTTHTTVPRKWRPSVSVYVCNLPLIL